MPSVKKKMSSFDEVATRRKVVKEMAADEAGKMRRATQHAKPKGDFTEGIRRYEATKPGGRKGVR